MLITICCILVRYKMYYLRFKCCLKKCFHLRPLLSSIGITDACGDGHVYSVEVFDFWRVFLFFPACDIIVTIRKFSG
jgi:hypothetical protein